MAKWPQAARLTFHWWETAQVLRLSQVIRCQVVPRKYCIAKLVALVILSCPVSVLAERSSIRVVHAFIAAYNEHDIERMLTFVTENIRWMSVEKENISVETSGKEALGIAMSAYFEGLPSARSKILFVHGLGEYVSVTEKAVWISDGVAQSQCAISVYHLTNGHISNVWYYSAQPCEKIGAR